MNMNFSLSEKEVENIVAALTGQPALAQGSQWYKLASMMAARLDIARMFQRHSRLERTGKRHTPQLPYHPGVWA